MNNRTNSAKGVGGKLLTRRDFLKLGLAAAGTLSLPILVRCRPLDVPITPNPATEKFRQPKEIRSNARGVLATSLLVRLRETSLPIPGADPQTRPVVRMYGRPRVENPRPDHDEDWDFALPGPTWRVNAGDRIQLKLYNRLDVVQSLNECEPAFYPTLTPTPPGTPSPTPNPTQTPTATPLPDTPPDCFHESNATNIHYHGLHVEQGAHADDVFITLYPHGQPGVSVDDCNPIGEYSYDFQIPVNHPKGTFWYHPHKHGSVALQMANGLCGTIIVEDDLNDDPVFQGQLKEYVMVFQTIQQTLNFPQGGHDKVSVFTVNGVQANSDALPEIRLKVGEVQRWRIVNATFQDSTDFNLQFTPEGTSAAEPEVYLMAMDGYFLPEDRWQKGTNKAEWFYSAPGNRTDFLVKGVAEGTFILEAEPNISGSSRQQQKQTPTPAPAAPTTYTFLKVIVQGKLDPPMGLPETLPALQEDQRPITDEEIAGRMKTLAFTVESGSAGGGPAGAPKYLINGTQFDPNVVNECVEVDTAEEWTLENYSAPGHPFHIHLNPFFVTDYYDPNDYDPDEPQGKNVRFNNPKGLWQDVIIVPAVDKTDPKNPGRVVIRHRFPKITGKFVLHCHILGHEDRGFMHVVEVHAQGASCSALTCGHGH